ncbi:inosine guanosine and xanthosine phosphorylase family protein [alpha proteobacterium BAL199]|nr:inosine guanosine and xanthosine phosphorylase family protein [alpha proteobacterium BAL199]
MSEIDALDAAVAAIRKAAPAAVPRVGIVLGSGLGGVADAVVDAVDIPYGDIPGFPKPGVASHAGRLRLGTLSSVPVAVLQGRAHAYEGNPMVDVVRPVRVLARLGCSMIILTNAAGSLRAEVGAGRLMLITDHINGTGLNPLVGPNEPALGQRFFDMSAAYDAALRTRLHGAATAEGIDLAEGVYYWALGPSFETPAEIRAFRTLGADAVGMSTVPETTALRHMGVRVAAISGITNLAAGMVAGSALDHAETMTQGSAMAGNLTRLLSRFLTGWTDAA